MLFFQNFYNLYLLNQYSPLKLNLMKNVFLLLICATFLTATYAQTSDAEAKAMADLMGIQKKEAIAKLMTLSGKDSTAFWKLYDEYMKENSKMSQVRIQLYEQTAHSYSILTPAVADTLAKQFFINRSSQEESLQKYYDKIKKATNAVVAFEFYQAEVYLLTQIRAAIMQQIPTYGEFKKMIKQ